VIFVARRHRRPRRRGARVRRPSADRRPQLAAETHVDRSIDGPRPFIDNQHRRRVRAARGGAFLRQRARRRGARRLPFLHVSTDEVYGTLGADGLFRRSDALRAEFAVRGEQGGRRPPGARLLPHLRRAGRRHQLLEQLRAVSVSGEADSADAPQRARGKAAADLRATAATCATGCTSRITAPGSCWSSPGAVPARNTTIGGGNERTNLEIVDRVCDAVDALQPAASNARAGGQAIPRAESVCPPIARGTIAATRSMRRGFGVSSAGRRATPSRRASPPPRAGTSSTASGAIRSRPGATRERDGPWVNDDQRRTR